MPESERNGMEWFPNQSRNCDAVGSYLKRNGFLSDWWPVHWPHNGGDVWDAERAYVNYLAGGRGTNCKSISRRRRSHIFHILLEFWQGYGGYS
jgi:hypothetical protein